MYNKRMLKTKLPAMDGGSQQGGNPGELIVRTGAIPAKQDLRKVNPAMNPGELVVRTGAIPAEQDLHGCKSCV
jgi:hypothetical protein